MLKLLARSEFRSCQLARKITKFPDGLIIRRQFSSKDLNYRFRQAVEALEKSKPPEKPVSNEIKLKLYALFKQAEKGPCVGSRPGMFDVVNRAKYDAWKSLGDMSSDAAMNGYIQGVSDIFGGSIPVLPISMVPDTKISTSEVKSSEEHLSNSSSKLHLRDFDELFARPMSPESSESIASQLTRIELVLPSSNNQGVATIALNRPKKGNAFDLMMWEELRYSWQAVSGDKRVKAVVLTGRNQTFSTGMDISVFVNLQSKLSAINCEARRRESLKQFIRYLQSVITAAEECPVPVISAVTGHCIGGGIDLLTATDLRYATKSSQFSVKEIDLAILADMGTIQRLPKLIGQQRAMELCLTGRTFSGEEAEKIGLVAQAFDTEEEMMQHVNSIALQIAKKSPLTVRGVKNSMLYCRDHSVADGLEHVQLWNSSMVLSNDLLTAVTAIMKKEEPVFKDL